MQETPEMYNTKTCTKKPILPSPVGSQLCHLKTRNERGRRRRRRRRKTSTLAVLAVVLVLGDEARDAERVGDGVVDVEEGERGRGAGLPDVHGLEGHEAAAGGEVVAERDAGGQVGRAVEGAGPEALVAVHEGVLEDPVGAGGRLLEALGHAVAGGADAVAREEVQLRHHPGHVDAAVVPHAPALAGRRGQLGEPMLGHPALADGPVVVGVGGVGEDVELGVVVVADLDGEGGGDGEGGHEDGGQGGGGEVHFCVFIFWY